MIKSSVESINGNITTINVTFTEDEDDSEFDFLHQFSISEFGKKFDDWLTDNSQIWMWNSSFYIGDEQLYDAKGFRLIDSELKFYQEETGNKLDHEVYLKLKEYILEL